MTARMDYIQNDLDLIRMAASSNDSEGSIGKPKHKQKKEKPNKNLKSQKTGGASAQSRGTKPAKQRSKTMSPEKLEKELKKLERKEKAASRKSMGGVKNSPALGKIKLPSMKKQTPTPHKEPSTPALKRKLSAEPKHVKSPAPALKPSIPPKITTTPVGTGRSRNSLDPNAVPIEAIRFEEGAKIEAVDHGQWYKGKIVKVDQDKMDILVHFDGWGARFDTWFPMTSTLIRGRTQLDSKPDQPKYESDEDVLAKWLDGNFYPATVLEVKASGSCMVMYFDGMKKLLRPNMMKKMSEKEKETAMKAVEKMLLLTPTVASPQSSISAGSPSSADGSTFRRYKTSANDRERRIAARSGRGTKSSEAKAVQKKAVKRKASQMAAAIESTPTEGILLPEIARGRTSRHSSDDEDFNAKKARLDRITDNLLDRVSPTSDSSLKKDSEATKDTGASASLTKPHEDEGGDSDSDSPLVIDEELAQPAKKRKIKQKSKSEPAGARGPNSGVRRARPKSSSKRPYSPQVPKQEASEKQESGDSDAAEPLPTSIALPAAVQEKVSDKLKNQLDKAPQEAGSSHDKSRGIVKESAGVAPEVDQAKNERAPMKTGNLSEVPATSQVHEKTGADVSEKGGEKDLLPKISTVYKKGDIVLAKWADCRSYLAYVIKKEDDDNYKIQYYDGMIKTVKSSFIHPWVGPLPDALKSFKPRSPPKPKRRRRSSDPKQMRTKRDTKPAPKQATKRTSSMSAPEPPKASRRRSRTSSEGVPLDIIQYSPAEKVLAKWTDLKWYPAMVVCQTDNDHYKVKYHDDLIRIVRDTWLTPWKPPAQLEMKPTESTPEPAAASAAPPSEKTESDVIEKPASEPVVKETEEMGVTKEQESRTKQNKPEEGSIIEAGEVVGLGEQSIKTYEKFNVDDTVLARWTDCRSYPATVKKVLEDGRYVVEYYDGMQRELKPAMLKSWNPSAMPPTIRPRKPRKAAPDVEGTDTTSGKLRTTRLSAQGKQAGRLQPAQKQTGNLPRQVVRGYDAYYARLPAAADVTATEHHKFKCRVPGCTKSFRKEELLRQHHKYYHQQRYKLRDMETTSVAPRRRSSKEDTIIRRRVSADYEAITKGLDMPSHPLVTIQDAAGNMPQSRGAKPPIDIYRKQHANISISSVSSMLDSSSGLEEAKPKEEATEEFSSEIAGDSKLISAEPKVGKRKRKRQSAEQTEVGKSTPPQDTFPDAVSVEKTTPESQEEDQQETVNEDVIRCVCGMEEEEGFMIQCEGCFTWQHGACVGVEQPNDASSSGTSRRKMMAEKKAKEEPTTSKTNVKGTEQEAGKDRGQNGTNDSYICWVCKNPQNVRESKKYLYSNEFLTKGKLPSLTNLDSGSSNAEASFKDDGSFEVTMRAVHQVMDEVVKLQDALHGIKQKIKVVASPGEHPLLKTWKEKIDDSNPSLQNGKPHDTLTSEVDQNGSSAKVNEQNVESSKNPETEAQPPPTDSVGKDTPSPKSSTSAEQTVQRVDKSGTANLSTTQATAPDENPTSANDKTAKKPKKKVSGRRGRSSSSEMSSVERESYIHQSRENLLNHILELEKTLDDRITLLEDYMSKIEYQVGSTATDGGGEIGKLQEDLTAVQKLLLYC